jgi:predicted DNA-binding transcriptional regulator YafY
MSTSPQRQLRILQLVPRAPRKIAVVEIEARLAAEGVTIHSRTIRRDLEDLSKTHPLVCDDRTKPHGWSWARDAVPLLPPTLDPQTALAFHLLAEHAAPTLPPATLAHLRPYLDQASRVLSSSAGEALRRWPEKIRIVPHGLVLSPAPVDPAAYDVAYRAVLEGRKFRVLYRNAKNETKAHVVNALGLVVRGEQRYIVCTLRRIDQPTQLALSRIQSAELLDEPTTVPPGFDLDAFVRAGGLDVPHEEGAIALRFRVRREVGGFLFDTRLAPDQRVTARDDGWLDVEATVPSTRELRRWLESFGPDAEVLAPAALRLELARAAEASARLYATGAPT